MRAPLGLEQTIFTWLGTSHDKMVSKSILDSDVGVCLAA